MGEVGNALVLESIDALERVGCQFFACDGPTLEPVPMLTCFVCDLLARLRVAAGLPHRREDEMTAEERMASEHSHYMPDLYPAIARLERRADRRRALTEEGQ